MIGQVPSPQQQVYNLPVTIGGKLNMFPFPAESQGDFLAVKEELEDIDFKTEKDCQKFFEKVGSCFGVREMCNKVTYNPKIAEMHSNEIRGCFPFADFVRGRDIVEAFGLQECADVMQDIIDKVRNTVAVEDRHYKVAMENLDTFFELKRRGETF